MQNRYAGDIGDFGKLGLLRVLQSSGLSIGVNWYLVPDENHNNDGRFVHYLNTDNEKYKTLRQCDESLCRELKSIVDSKCRAVTKLQKKSILDAVFFQDVLDFTEKSKSERKDFRKIWHKNALDVLNGVDVVFVDPDNGLIVPTASETNKENKYVLPDELAQYYERGSSIIYYQHKARLDDSVYLNKHKELVSENQFFGASSLCLKFNKTSHRYYFFIIQPRHKAVIINAVNAMLSSKWQDCFSLLKIK